MRIFPLGDSAATIEFGNDISLDLNAQAVEIARNLNETPFAGLLEAVPAYASVTVFYDNRATFDSVKRILESRSRTIVTDGRDKTDLVEIPMTISFESSPDIQRIAADAELTEVDVVEIFLSTTYRVYMLGFLPGFAYMGEVNDRIAAPRLETPRTKVPKGSIGIAGKQTGIYPLESPGGWNIIGRTDLRMFDPTSPDPCLLKPGDEVRFVRC